MVNKKIVNPKSLSIMGWFLVLEGLIVFAIFLAYFLEWF